MFLHFRKISSKAVRHILIVMAMMAPVSQSVQSHPVRDRVPYFSNQVLYMYIRSKMIRNGDQRGPLAFFYLC